MRHLAAALAAFYVVLAALALVPVALAESTAPGPQVRATGDDLVVVLSADRGTATLGAPVALQFHATGGGDEIRVQWPDLRGALTAAFGEEVVEVSGGRARADGRTYVATIRFFDVGTFE